MWWSGTQITNRRPLVGALIGILTLCGCSSIAPIATPFTRNAPDFSGLDIEAMRGLARDIEREVRAGNREPELANRAGIVIDTPEIVQAIRTRAARAELVNKFLDSGHSWERRNGRLWVIRSQAYKAAGTRSSRDLDALMVNGENRDRWTIYESIVDESNLPSKSLTAVELIFFEARLEWMQPGQKYETESGETAVKQ